jgi:sigma-B regulation protein RsbU (phosphoserine phosphatase)
MAWLVITNAFGQERRVPIELDEMIIGRAKGLAITLDGTNISRRHARIIRQSGDFSVEDLGSSNGTFLNDRRINSRAALLPDDILRIGTHTLRFETESIPPADMTIRRQTAALAENEELYRENSAQKLQAVLELAHALSNTIDGETLLNRFLDQVLKLFPKADRALIILLEKEDPVVRLLRERQAVPSQGKLFSRSLLKQVVEKGMAVLAEDTGTLETNLTLNAMGVRSLLCVPLRAHGTSVFGVVQLDRFQAGQAFTAEDLHLLTAVTLQISLVLEKARLHEKLLVQERITRELALAREIQLAFLPRGVPALLHGPVDLFAELHPAEEVSGDFYDFIVLDHSRIALVVADVSGKGMPAALFMSMVRALLRQIVKTSQGAAEILTQLNNALAPDNPKFMFVTVLLGIYDASTGQCVFARGGHPAPVLRKSDGTAALLESHPGCLLGIEESCPPLHESSVLLQTGDTLIFYTDGITEAARKESGEMFGFERLLEAAKGVCPTASIREWAASLRSQVQFFCGENGPGDDITLLLLRHGAVGRC